MDSVNAACDIICLPCCKIIVQKLWPQIVQGSDFCSEKWDFPTQKSAPVPDVRGDFADFPNRQNRSALADLKTLRVFNLPAGHDFDARGLRLSRALLGFWQAATYGFSAFCREWFLCERALVVLRSPVSFGGLA
ncbi:MAG TPA: hypothetical protein IAB50_08105 [Candidatus Faecivicinus avistercoris]|nr:hypothetical protein [Candidatus Faecivicinus avistercoris]